MLASDTTKEVKNLFDIGFKFEQNNFNKSTINNELFLFITINLETI